MGLQRAMLRVALLGISIFTAGCSDFGVSEFRKDSGAKDLVQSSSLQSVEQVSRQAQAQIALGEFPSGFGAAHQSPHYNGVGVRSRAFPDGAREAHRLGLKTLKIAMAREVLVMPDFYSVAELEGVSNAQLLNSVQSLTDMAKLKSFDYVLSLPFETIFIHTNEIGITDWSSNTWNMNTVPLSQAALDNLYKQQFDFAVYLLNRFKGTGRTFVLQDHEADWHASVWNEAAGSYGENTDIGQANFLKYWPTRQRAVNDARRTVQSDVNVYNMCEVTRLRETVLNGVKSLTRDILPQVTCDLVGYSAHDTTLLPDDGATTRAAIAYIKSKAQPSPTFGTNQVIISEIALPELANGAYLPRKDQITKLIDESLRSGMRWVLYWQFYSNDTDSAGNWLVKSDNSFGLAMLGILNRFGMDPQAIARRVSIQPSFVQTNRAPTSSFDVQAARAAVESLYLEILGRSADSAGLNLWVDQLRQGQTLDQVRQGINGSQEAQQRRAAQRVQAIRSAVDALYREILGRAPDSAGLEFWAGEVINQRLTIDQVRQGIYDSLEAQQRRAAQQSSAQRSAQAMYTAIVQLGYTQYLPGCLTLERQDIWEKWFVNGGSQANFLQALANEIPNRPSCLQVPYSGNARVVFDEYQARLPGCWAPDRQDYWTAWFGRGGTHADFAAALQSAAATRPSCLR